MVSAKQIQNNWDRFVKLINELPKEKKENLLPNITQHEDRIKMMPASAKDWHHNAFPGGFVDHTLRVYDCALKMHKLWAEMEGNTDPYTLDELKFSVLVHDLGKIGLDEGEYYQPNDSQWHIDKLGQIYKFNTDIPAMKVAERSLFLLQSWGVKVTLNEHLAIKLHDGLYDDSNKFYLMSGMKETRLRNHLPILIHQADQMAAYIEFEKWAQENPYSNSNPKPKNGSKGDKTLRKAKSINIENNPNLTSKTMDVIDSFFNKD